MTRHHISQQEVSSMAIVRRSLIISLLTLLAVPAYSASLKKISVIDLPGPPGKRFDYLTIDYKNDYLLSAYLAAGLLYVIDLKTNKLVKAIPDVPGVEGVVSAPDLNKVYTSDWWENEIGVISLDQMKVVKKLPTASKPDGSAYAEPFHKVYVSDERGKAEAVVDARKDAVIKTLHFDSETGMPRYDPVARRVYVNLQDTNQFAVIDPSTDTVAASYPVGRCRGIHRLPCGWASRRHYCITGRLRAAVLHCADRSAVLSSLRPKSAGARVR
jgi:DNA-binding beta-propeller fold protein YncE